MRKLCCAAQKRGFACAVITLESSHLRTLNFVWLTLGLHKHRNTVSPLRFARVTYVGVRAPSQSRRLLVLLASPSPLTS